MQRLTTCFFLTFTMVLALALIGGCKPPSGEGVSKEEEQGEDGNPPEKEEPFLTPVVAKEIEREEIQASVAATASIVPIRARLLETEEAGRLHFAEQWEEGDFVEKGTVIARLESETLENDIERAKADVRLQEEALNIAKKAMDSSIRDYEITQDLYSKSIVAQKNLEDTQLAMERNINSFRQAQINLEKAEASLETLEARMDRLAIRAPFDGLLVASATLNGQAPFATAFGSETITDQDGRLVSSNFSACGIIDTSQVYLRSDVTSKDIDKIRPGQEAAGTVYASQDIAVNGEVVEISNAVSQDTNAFQVDVLVDNQDRRLRPGMFARVDIITERRPQAISISKDYIIRRNDRDVVFRVEQSENEEYKIAREVPVELGLEGSEKVEVTWGLREGDEIIVRGFEVLQDKTPISVIRADEPMRPEEEREQQEGEEERKKRETAEEEGTSQTS